MKFSFLSLLLLIQFSLFAQPKTNSALQVDKIISVYNKPNQPGLAISIEKDGAVVYKKGVGVANLEYGIPITTSTVFHVASVSKQFTAFAILLLQQDGKLSIDDDIRTYLTELPDYGHKITLRHFMNHTSGFHDYSDITNLLGIRNEDMMSNDQMVELLLKLKELNFMPGEQFQYCNSGYILLAEIVKRVSGKSFAEFTSERIFKPLGMKNSFFLDDPETIIKNKAYSYYEFNSILYKKILNFSFVGSSGLNTSSDDLILWAKNFERPKVGSAKLFNTMLQRGVLNNGDTIQYALGQELRNYKGLQLIFHGGGDAGYRSYLVRIPAHHFSVAILSNDEKFNPLDIVFDIIDVYLSNKETKSSPVKPPVPNEALLATFDGDYEVFPGMIVTISHADNHLYLQSKGDTSKIELPCISLYEYLFPAKPHSKIVFKPSSNKTVESFTWHFSDFSYPAKKISLPPLSQLLIRVSDYTGRYLNTELNTVYELVVQNNQLVALHNRNYDIQLTPIQDDVFISGNSFFGQLDFIREGEETITGFTLSGQNTRGLHFERIKPR